MAFAFVVWRLHSLYIHYNLCWRFAGERPRGDNTGGDHAPRSYADNNKGTVVARCTASNAKQAGAARGSGPRKQGEPTCSQCSVGFHQAKEATRPAPL